jgi:hypothetical protein
MAYKLKELKTMNDFKFDRELKAIMKLLKDTWDIKAAPKGYAKFMEDYNDYEGMEDVQENEKQLLRNFKGHSDGTISSDGLVLRLTKEYVGYDDQNQVQEGPLEVLIQVILTHGIVLGQRLAEIDKKSEPYRRIQSIKHAYDMSDHTDKELGEIYYKEFEALLNFENISTLREIQDAFESKRRELELKRFIPILQNYIKDHKSFVAYQSSKDKELLALWRYIHAQTGSDSRFNNFRKDMIAMGVDIECDGQHTFIVTCIN